MVEWRGQQLLALVRKASMQGVVQATELVRNEAISLITDGQKTGRVYRRRNVVHQASAPGEAPASDTGTLARQIDTKYDFVNLIGTVVARTKYAAMLEGGTPNMEPRPFMRPALMNKRLAVQSAIAESIRRVLV